MLIKLFHHYSNMYISSLFFQKPITDTCMLLKSKLCETTDKIHYLNNQRYVDIARKHLDSKKLFEDETFPPNNRSLRYRKRAYPKIRWLRPKEIYADAKFFISFPTRRDPIQGSITDCWLVSAICSLIQFPKIFEHVVPEEQNFSSSHYCGVFYFRIWNSGKWYEVVVDDRLPILEKNMKPLGLISRNYPDEFWCSLLEKAYAKLYGGYYNLEGGTPSEALIDLTGGISQKCNLKSYRKRISGDFILFEYVKRSLRHHCMMGCSISPHEGKYNSEDILKNGLVVGHSYCILRQEEVIILNLTTSLLRIRNPWGNAIKWNGPWSPKDRRWKYIKNETKIRLSINEQVDGEFWMAFTDWLDNFDVLEVCHLSPDTLSKENLLINGEDSIYPEKEWRCSIFEGSWETNISAGGRCDKQCEHGCQYWINPQIPIIINEIGRHSYVFCLSQMNRRLSEISDPCERFEYVQIRLYRAIREKNGQIFADKNSYIDSTGPYINRRDISMLVTLDPGIYILVASTYDPNVEGQFIIRSFSDQLNNKKRTFDVPLGDIDDEDDSWTIGYWNCCKFNFERVKQFIGSYCGNQSIESDESS